MDNAAPAAAQPDSARPTRVEDNVHVLRWAVLPVQRLAELEALFADGSAEQALVGRLAVKAHHVLADNVADVLDQPG